MQDDGILQEHRSNKCYEGAAVVGMEKVNSVTATVRRAPLDNVSGSIETDPFVSNISVT